MYKVGDKVLFIAGEVNLKAFVVFVDKQYFSIINHPSKVVVVTNELSFKLPLSSNPKSIDVIELILLFLFKIYILSTIFINLIPLNSDVLSIVFTFTIINSL